MKLIAVLLGLATCQVVLSNPVKRAADCGCIHDGTVYTRDVGETWTDSNCVSYVCAEHESVQVVEYGCLSDDPQDPTGCYSVGENWRVSYSGYCVDYTCFDPPAPYIPYRKIDGLACQNAGQCVEHGESWPSTTSACVVYTCNIDMTTYSITAPYSAKCVSNDPSDPPNTCKDVDSNWSFQVASGEAGYCADYQCVQSSDPAVLPSPQRTNLACRWQGACYNDGEGWDVPDCQSKTCNVDLAAGTYGTSGAYRGCYIGGACYDDADTWKDCNSLQAPDDDVGYCYYYQCDYTGTQYNTNKVDTKCTLNDVEYDMDDWQLRNSTNCQYFTCHYTAENVLNTIFQTHCKDCDGSCHEFGTSGWPYYVNGTREEDCTCNASDPTGGANVYTCN